MKLVIYRFTLSKGHCTDSPGLKFITIRELI